MTKSPIANGNGKKTINSKLHLTDTSKLRDNKNKKFEITETKRSQNCFKTAIALSAKLANDNICLHCYG